MLFPRRMEDILDSEHLAYWRNFVLQNANMDVVFLTDLANVLGTSAAYLLGETDNPSLPAPDDAPVVIQSSDPSRKITSEPSRLTFHNGDVSIDIPDTPANKKWFDDFIKSIMQMKSSKPETTLQPA